MEIRHLQTFAVAAETQSFTRTAELVGLTQSAVSQQVSLLEKELGRLLFERGPKSVALTEFGRTLHDRARQILKIVEEIRQEADQISNELTGTVTIASSTVPSEWLLPELLSIIRGSHPLLQESVSVSDSEQAMSAVALGHADFAIVGELPRGASLCAKRVAEDELVLVVASQHPFACEKVIQPHQLVGQPMISREPGSGSRRCIENALSATGISISELSIPVEVNSNDAIRSLVERNVGISFLSLRAIQRDIDDGRLVKVDVKSVRIIRGLYLVTNPQRLPSPVVTAVLALVDEYCKNLNRPVNS